MSDSKTQIDVPDHLRPVLQRLAQLEEEGRWMSERLSAALVIAKGQLASEIKNGIGIELLKAAGADPQRGARFAPDFSALDLQPPEYEEVKVNGMAGPTH